MNGVGSKTLTARRLGPSRGEQRRIERKMGFKSFGWQGHGSFDGRVCDSGKSEQC